MRRGIVAMLVCGSALTHLGGCANTMSGTLDGQRVGPARSAIFDDAEMSMSVPGFGELLSIQAVQLFVTGFPDACALFELAYDVDYTSCEEMCEDLHEFATDQLSADEYWNVSVTLFPDEAVDTEYTQGSPLDDIGLDDIDWWNLDDLSLSGNDTFAASAAVWDISAWYDLADCEAACEDNEGVVAGAEVAEGGEVTVNRFTEGSLLKGNFAMDFGGGDEIKGKFDAEYCELGLDNLLEY